MKRRNDGNTVLITLGTLTIIAAVLGVAVSFTQSVGRAGSRARALATATAVADGCLERAFADWRSISRQSLKGDVSTTTLSAQIVPPDSNSLPQLDRYPLVNYSVQAWDVTSNAPADQPTPVVSSSGATNSYYYLASADVVVPALGGTNVQARVRRMFRRENQSPFRYAIFYNDLMEVHPGPLFHITGLVHSNMTIYAAHETLTFEDKVTSTGGYFNEYAPLDPRNGTPSTEPTFPDNMPASQTPREDPLGISPSQFNKTDTNQNNDSYREIIERPTIGQADLLTDNNGVNSRYYTYAAVKVLVNASNAVTILNGAGNAVSPSSPDSADRALYAAVAGAITTNQTIQDNREGASVRLTTLDVAALNTASVPGWNGVIYLSDTSAGQTGGTPKRGIRVKNGATLPPGGLSVVTDNPLYVQGDFNTGSTSTTKPPSNSGDSSNPTVSGYTRKPAALIGDAVNILSNAWNDSNSTSGLSSRIASNTTVNAAILSGNVASDGNRYSGGVENFPRFLENWNTKTLTYYGSMVQLFASQQSIGQWGSSNVYSPPIRNWYFDTNFRNVAPPGPLFTMIFLRQRWFVQ